MPDPNISWLPACDVVFFAFLILRPTYLFIGVKKAAETLVSASSGARDHVPSFLHLDSHARNVLQSTTRVATTLLLSVWCDSGA